MSIINREKLREDITAILTDHDKSTEEIQTYLDKEFDGLKYILEKRLDNELYELVIEDNL